MLIEDAVLLIVSVFGLGTIGIYAHRIYTSLKKKDPMAAARQHKREAEERLAALRTEAEAAQLEREAERAIDELYEDELKKENHRG